jgi:hypothetical protein
MAIMVNIRYKMQNYDMTDNWLLCFRLTFSPGLLSLRFSVPIILVASLIKQQDRHGWYSLLCETSLTHCPPL